MLHLDQALLHLLKGRSLHSVLTFNPKLLFQCKDLLEFVLELLAETVYHSGLDFQFFEGRGLLQRNREIFVVGSATTSIEVTVMVAGRTIKFFILRQVIELGLLNPGRMVGNSSYLDLQRAFVH